MQTRFSASCKLNLREVRAGGVSNEPRRDRQYDFIFRRLIQAAGEQPSNARDVAKPRDLVRCTLVLIVNETREDLVLSIF